MSLFDRNPNEVAYVGGKKHWVDVIKNSGPGDLLIWRQPEEDFNIHSTLVVMPGEQAIFINRGNVEAIFDSGTYALSTQNYPFISRLRNALSGGISTFNSVVYFVRAADSAEILWGTDSPIQVRDKVLGIATKIRGRGSYKVRITNPSIFLSKLIGNNIQCSTQDELKRYFSNEFQSKIKSIIARSLNESNIEILGIDSRLDEYSEILEPYLNEIFSAYGLYCVKFSIASLEIEDDELRRKYDEIGMNATEKIVNANADNKVMGILGDNWGRQQAANILGDLAKNPGSGGAAAAGAGIGMGVAAGGVFAGMAQQMFAPMNNHPVQQNQQQNQPSRFTQSGNSVPSQVSQFESNPVESLKKLQLLLDDGLITADEYNEKKKEILSRL